MNKEIDGFIHGIEKALKEYMECPLSGRTLETICLLIQAWEKAQWLSQNLNCESDCEDFTEILAEKWNQSMQNADGTQGGHWRISDTTDVSESLGLDLKGIPEYAWNVTMNLMYSDYYDTAVRFGVNNAEFYARLAYDFLFDKDGKPPIEKLFEYRKNIVE